MQISFADNQLSWTRAADKITIQLPGIVSSLVDTHHQRVLAIVADEKHGDQLYAFTYEGSEIFHKNSPNDGRIYYLTDHPSHGVLAVLALEIPIEAGRTGTIR